MPVIPCAPVSPVYGIVTFDPVAFQAAYPEFAGISDAVLAKEFALAQLQLNNSCGSRVRDGNIRETLLSLLVAHLTYLDVGTDDGAGNVQPPPGIVGVISNATEGTVSVGTAAIQYGGPSQPYYMQSKYGYQFWTATARWRTMINIAAPVQYTVFDGGPFGIGPGGISGPDGGGCGC